jgi:hypothetical protein
MRYFFILIAALFISSALSTSEAQVHVNINFNLGTQPGWGPVGYDYVEYYYIPAIDVYYNVPLQCYYYHDHNRWIRSEYLPRRYHDYDLYRGYKVVINERDPWKRDRYYRKKYYRERDRHDQEIIRDSKDPKYFMNKHSRRHDEWLKEHPKDRGRHEGHGDHHKH